MSNNSLDLMQLCFLGVSCIAQQKTRWLLESQWACWNMASWGSVYILKDSVCLVINIMDLIKFSNVRGILTARHKGVNQKGMFWGRGNSQGFDRVVMRCYECYDAKHFVWLFTQTNWGCLDGIHLILLAGSASRHQKVLQIESIISSG